MVNYNQAKIYKMESLSGLLYIGSTCEPTLARRLAKHKADYNYWKQGKRHFTTSYKLFEDGSVDIYLIESYPCNSKDELHARESYWIRQTECVNKVIPGRTQAQYRIDNKEKIRQKHEQYRINNKEKIEKYLINNREKIRQRDRIYRINNREIIREKNRKKTNCICGSTHLKREKARHVKTQKHISFMEVIDKIKTHDPVLFNAIEGINKIRNYFL